MSGTLGQRQPSQVVIPVTRNGGLKKMPPYWYPYTTMAKERWLGREILEIVSTEFRDRSLEYYRYALESGVTTINGKVAKPDTVVRNGDRIENVVHRHEPPVTATPVKIILHDNERDFLVINKPGSIPVHASGRYYRHSLVEMLRYEFGFDNVYTHQIRVHLQYLGHPIANDPVYSDERIWGPNLGKHGIDVIPSSERFAPTPPEHLKGENSPESLATSGTCIDLKPNSGENGNGTEDGDNNETYPQQKKLLPRETGHDIGMGSPVPLSTEAIQIITRLRNMKDEDEDWSRWRDVIFQAKGALAPKSFRRPPALPPQNKRKRGRRNMLKPMATESDPEHFGRGTAPPEDPAERPPTPPLSQSESTAREQLTSDRDTPAPPDPEDPAQLTFSEATPRLPLLLAPEPEADPATGTLYCSECYLPLHPDPKPEKLYIFLHALKYELSLGRFETEFPEWAKEGWEGGAVMERLVPLEHKY
ncbi:hypothetical protein J3R83DRAFT_2384 [Lanmaoa asiatica]|nr:hypothetical protein J3R83DRAFT_2384 [Lanmaoa asiatica]